MPHDFGRFAGLALFCPGLLAPSGTKELVEFYGSYQGATDDLYGAWKRNSRFGKNEGKFDGDGELISSVRCYRKFREMF